MYLYSVRIRENADQNNSKYEYFYNHERLSMNVSWYPLNGLTNNKIWKKLLITCSNQFSSYSEVYSERYKRSKMEPFTKIVVSQKSQYIWQGFETPFSILMWVLR